MNKIYGINAAYESLKNNRVKNIYFQTGFSNTKILELARLKKVHTVFIDKNEFTKKFKGNTQGCVCETIPFETYELSDVINENKNDKHSVVVILDELNDPHNLGAILRSSDVFSVSAIIYKKHNSVGLNETVAKVSTGAINYVKCCEVSNLNQAIAKLKDNGYWVIGLDGEAKGNLKTIPDEVPLAIVVGSEGYGISRLVKENCDLMVKIPMSGHVSCLNASVSCAIVLYQIRNR